MNDWIADIWIPQVAGGWCGLVSKGSLRSEQKVDFLDIYTWNVSQSQLRKPGGSTAVGGDST